MLKQIPNFLTILRFLLIPFIILFALQREYMLTIIIVLFSGATDMLDGFLARKFNLVSDFRQTNGSTCR